MPRLLSPGEPAPWFHAAALGGNTRFAFNTAAGRWILLLFLGDRSGPALETALPLIAANRSLFDDHRASFFGVTVNSEDVEKERITHSIPGIRWFLDFDCRISEAYGAYAEQGPQRHKPCWLLLDPMLRAHSYHDLSAGARVMELLKVFVKTDHSVPAPVLVIPRLISSEICNRLIRLYDENGGAESGFMREIDGRTRVVTDHNYKRRSDYQVGDTELIAALNARIYHVLRPMLQRAFQFDATRIERWIVARYDAEVGGYFRPHRDNTTKGTAHRKFAVTVNLDTSTYEGGDLRFPEFGNQTYRAPTGGAVVFSCSLLHEALPVTTGTRYAFLTFLYDDASARLREKNLAFVDLQ